MRKNKEPFYLTSAVQHWKKSLKSWSYEKDQKDSIKKAKELIAEARILQEYPYDHRADVLYLRASTVLHNALKKENSNAVQAEIYYLLARCYEVLKDVGLWNLNEMYYESCIRKNPHTKLSTQCFEAFERSIYLGYSGSGGTFVPYRIRKKLDELNLLAFEIKP